MSLAFFDWFGLALVFGCIAWCVPGGIVRPGLALAGVLVGGFVIAPIGIAIATAWVSQPGSSAELSNFQLAIFLILAGAGGVVGWQLGKPLAVLVNFVPGLNLLNLGAGLVIGSAFGLVLLLFVFNLLLLVAPLQFKSEQLTTSWFAVHLLTPLSSLAWWLTPTSGHWPTTSG